MIKKYVPITLSLLLALAVVTLTPMAASSPSVLMSNISSKVSFAKSRVAQIREKVIPLKQATASQLSGDSYDSAVKVVHAEERKVVMYKGKKLTIPVVDSSDDIPVGILELFYQAELEKEKNQFAQ